MGERERQECVSFEETRSPSPPPHFFHQRAVRTCRTPLMVTMTVVGVVDDFTYTYREERDVRFAGERARTSESRQRGGKITTGHELIKNMLIIRASFFAPISACAHAVGQHARRYLIRMRVVRFSKVYGIRRKIFAGGVDRPHAQQCRRNVL